MPYIPKDRRVIYDDVLNDARSLLSSPMAGKGELTYLLYTIAKRWPFRFNAPPRYTSISNAVSALEDAAHELRRRFLDPYEDKQRKKNGDIE